MGSLARLLYRDLLFSFYYSRWQVFLGVIGPLLWAYVAGIAFGSLIREVRIGSETFSYIQYLTPGIIGSSTALASLLRGALIWIDRRQGMFEQLLSCLYSPTQYYISKVGISVVVGLIWSTSLLLAFLPVLSISLESIITGFVPTVVLASLLFGAISIALSMVFPDYEKFNFSLNFIGTILVFLSSAYYPIQLTATPLNIIGSVNPLTFVVDDLRQTILGVTFVPSYSGGSVVLLAESLVAFTLSTLLFNAKARKIRGI